MTVPGPDKASEPPQTPALPSAELLRRQSAWLGPARSRLFRRISIAQRQCVLDLGAGFGAVTGELVRRSSGHVVALDLALPALLNEESFAGALRIVADASYLPFAPGTFDLVFCQYALLWFEHPEVALSEIWRVLQAGGSLVAIEPDYGGLMEYPEAVAVRQLWLATLKRAGAEPMIGRRLPDLLARQGFRVRVDLLETIQQASAERYDFLREMPMNETELAQLEMAESASGDLEGWRQLAHLPLFLITADKLA